jgi:hypothetical protein
VKTIARKIGLNPSSNGQFTKTALEAGGLAVRWFATQMLGLRPQCVAKGPSSGGSPSPYRKDLDPPINDRALDLRRGALRTRTFCLLGHETQYETSRPPVQAPAMGSKSQIRSAEASAKPLIYQRNLRIRESLSSRALHGRRAERGTMPAVPFRACLASFFRAVGKLGRARWRPAPLIVSPVSPHTCKAAASSPLFRGDQPHPLQTCLDRAQGASVALRNRLQRLLCGELRA